MRSLPPSQTSNSPAVKYLDSCIYYDVPDVKFSFANDFGAVSIRNVYRCCLGGSLGKIFKFSLHKHRNN